MIERVDWVKLSKPNEIPIGVKYTSYDNRYWYISVGIEKGTNDVKLIDRKLSNIQINYIHQTTSAIVKTKPLRVVMENLNLKGMMKNKHLAE